RYGPTASAPAANAAPHTMRHGASWMLPEAAHDDLLYTSDWRAGNVYVYSYPQGKLVGTLTGFDEPEGMCTDAAGDIWVTTYAREALIEYAHGGISPIATLDEGDYAEPNSCAIDPRTGDLATSNRFPEAIAVFKGASGSPAFYPLDGYNG